VVTVAGANPPALHVGGRGGLPRWPLIDTSVTSNRPTPICANTSEQRRTRAVEEALRTDAARDATSREA